jgi:hypothetical protein
VVPAAGHDADVELDLAPVPTARWRARRRGCMPAGEVQVDVLARPGSASARRFDEDTPLMVGVSVSMRDSPCRGSRAPGLIGIGLFVDLGLDGHVGLQRAQQARVLPSSRSKSISAKLEASPWSTSPSTPAPCRWRTGRGSRRAAARCRRAARRRGWSGRPRPRWSGRSGFNGQLVGHARSRGGSRRRQHRPRRRPEGHVGGNGNANGAQNIRWSSQPM